MKFHRRIFCRDGGRSGKKFDFTRVKQGDFHFWPARWREREKFF
jgi:hypothetical protein